MYLKESVCSTKREVQKQVRREGTLSKSGQEMGERVDGVKDGEVMTSVTSKEDLSRKHY